MANKKNKAFILKNDDWIEIHINVIGRVSKKLKIQEGANQVEWLFN